MKNKKDNKIEYVYVLTNPAMPEYVKVGRTNNIERRIKDLSKDTSVPLPYLAVTCKLARGVFALWN